jgi:hypothetical protein
MDGGGAGTQHRPPSGRCQRQRPASQLPDAFLDPGQLRPTEAGRQCRRRGRRRCRHRGQRLPGDIGTAAIQAGQEVPAEHLGLRQRQQELPAGKATVTLFDRADRVIEGRHHTQTTRQLGDHDHARRRRQRHVRSTYPDLTCQTTYRVHRTGALSDNDRFEPRNPNHPCRQGIRSPIRAVSPSLPADPGQSDKV